MQLDGLGPHDIQHQVLPVTGLASPSWYNSWMVQQLLMSSSDLLESGGIFVSSLFSKLQVTFEGCANCSMEWNKSCIWLLLKYWLDPLKNKHTQLSSVHVGQSMIARTHQDGQMEDAFGFTITDMGDSAI